MHAAILRRVDDGGKWRVVSCRAYTLRYRRTATSGACPPPRVVLDLAARQTRQDLLDTWQRPQHTGTSCGRARDQRTGAGNLAGRAVETTPRRRAGAGADSETPSPRADVTAGDDGVDPA